METISSIHDGKFMEIQPGDGTRYMAAFYIPDNEQISIHLGTAGTIHGGYTLQRDQVANYFSRLHGAARTDSDIALIAVYNDHYYDYVKGHSGLSNEWSNVVLILLAGIALFGDISDPEQIELIGHLYRGHIEKALPILDELATLVNE